MLIDGHRRYLCAKEIGIETLPCDVYQIPAEDAELDRIRYELQNDRRPWKIHEKAEALQRMKEKKKFHTTAEFAEYAQISSNSLGTSMKLQALKEQYKDLITKYEISESYQVEFLRLYPSVRPIKNFTIEQIIENIFKRVRYQVITCGKEFRDLTIVFRRASTNETEIVRYLNNPDMTVKELLECTNRLGFLHQMEDLMKEIKERRSRGKEFTSADQQMINAFSKLIQETFNVHQTAAVK